MGKLNLSEAERMLLSRFLESDEVDAKVCAETMWSLVNKGLVRLGGTLEKAHVTLTRSGVDALKAAIR